jgi:hypothetical protein
VAQDFQEEASPAADVAPRFEVRPHQNLQDDSHFKEEVKHEGSVCQVKSHVCVSARTTNRLT